MSSAVERSEMEATGHVGHLLDVSGVHDDSRSSVTTNQGGASRAQPLFILPSGVRVDVDIDCCSTVWEVKVRLAAILDTQPRHVNIAIGRGLLFSH